ncbi:MAG: hypothetical protein Q9M41_05330 [Paracoccaceae bacterium]|nr:hypothetical protein [Paracoccaceae bacterium]
MSITPRDSGGWFMVGLARRLPFVVTAALLASPVFAGVSVASCGSCSQFSVLSRLAVTRGLIRNGAIPELRKAVRFRVRTGSSCDPVEARRMRKRYDDLADRLFQRAIKLGQNVGDCPVICAAVMREPAFRGYARLLRAQRGYLDRLGNALLTASRAFTVDGEKTAVLRPVSVLHKQLDAPAQRALEVFKEGLRALSGARPRVAPPREWMQIGDQIENIGRTLAVMVRLKLLEPAAAEPAAALVRAGNALVRLGPEISAATAAGDGQHGMIARFLVARMVGAAGDLVFGLESLRLSAGQETNGKAAVLVGESRQEAGAARCLGALTRAVSNAGEGLSFQLEQLDQCGTTDYASTAPEKEGETARMSPARFRLYERAATSAFDRLNRSICASQQALEQ